MFICREKKRKREEIVVVVVVVEQGVSYRERGRGPARAISQKGEEEEV